MSEIATRNIWQKAEELVKGQGAESLSKLVPDVLQKELERMEVAEQLKEGIEKIVLKLDTEKVNSGRLHLMANGSLRIMSQKVLAVLCQ